MEKKFLELHYSTIVRRILLWAVYLYASLAAGFMFKAAWLWFSFEGWLGAIYRQAGSFELYFKLSIVTFLVFLLVDLILPDRDEKKKLVPHLTAIGMMLMALANCTLGWGGYGGSGKFLLVLFNILGMSIFFILVRVSAAKRKAKLAGFICLGNAVLLFWVNLFSGVDIANPIDMVLLLVLVMFAVIFFLTASKLESDKILWDKLFLLYFGILLKIGADFFTLMFAVTVGRFHTTIATADMVKYYISSYPWTVMFLLGAVLSLSLWSRFSWKHTIVIFSLLMANTLLCWWAGKLSKGAPYWDILGWLWIAGAIICLATRVVQWRLVEKKKLP